MGLSPGTRPMFRVAFALSLLLLPQLSWGAAGSMGSAALMGKAVLPPGLEPSLGDHGTVATASGLYHACKATGEGGVYIGGRTVLDEGQTVVVKTSLDGKVEWVRAVDIQGARELSVIDDSRVFLVGVDGKVEVVPPLGGRRALGATGSQRVGSLYETAGSPRRDIPNAANVAGSHEGVALLGLVMGMVLLGGLCAQGGEQPSSAPAPPPAPAPPAASSAPPAPAPPPMHPGEPSHGGDARPDGPSHSDSFKKENPEAMLRRMSSGTERDRVKYIQFEELQIGQEIGEGAYKTVFDGVWQGKRVAITLINQGLDKLEREVEVMHRLSMDPNLVQLYGVSAKDNDTYLVMELLEAGALDLILQSKRHEAMLNDLDKIKIAYQICQGMAAVATENIIHADLAARNVLVKSLRPPVVKIADFGLSKLALHYYGTVSNGIPVRWSPPEVMLKGKWSEKSDVWAFGVVVWELYSRASCPYGLNRSGYDVQQYVCKGGRLPRPEGCPEVLYQVMIATWHQTPDGRPTFRQLRKKLAGLVKQGEEGTLPGVSNSREPPAQ